MGLSVVSLSNDAVILCSLTVRGALCQTALPLRGQIGQVKVLGRASVLPARCSPALWLLLSALRHFVTPSRESNTGFDLVFCAVKCKKRGVFEPACTMTPACILFDECLRFREKRNARLHGILGTLAFANARMRGFLGKLALLNLRKHRDALFSRNAGVFERCETPGCTAFRESWRFPTPHKRPPRACTGAFKADQPALRTRRRTSCRRASCPCPRRCGPRAWACRTWGTRA